MCINVYVHIFMYVYIWCLYVHIDIWFGCRSYIYIYIYIYMYVCMYVCMYIYTHIHSYIHIWNECNYYPCHACTNMHDNIMSIALFCFSPAHGQIWACTQVFCVCVYIRMYVCSWSNLGMLCVYVCMYVYVCVYIYMYTYMHMYMYI
jgi:hypothetical protein